VRRASPCLDRGGCAAPHRSAPQRHAMLLSARKATVSTMSDHHALELSYDAYPRLEEDFQAALDVSLKPRGHEMLYDLVHDLGMPAGATAVDVGCGEGTHTLRLAEQFAFVVCGIDPVLFAVSGLGLPWGASEYDLAGHIQKAPVRVIKGEITGLPIPASAEIVLEGEIPPPDVESEMEGPFGEWTGYYASGTRPSPIIRVKAVYHRNDPILTVLPDFKTYPLSSYMFLVFCAAGLWSEIEKAGITDIRGVWYAEWGIRFFAVISVMQRYGGHARQAAHIALGAREGAYLGRFIVLVDDDIDPSNMNDVLWALSTRCDPQTSIDIAANCWSTPIDPRLAPEKRKAGDFTNSRAILDACRPFSWRDQFPKVHSIDAKYQDEIRQKWRDIFS